jgi:predicted nuclease of predicted toxin-antitoxin system
MRILANENIPGTVVDALRSRGDDVTWIRTDAPDASDRAVLEIAQRENRLIVTFDKDFGELAYHANLPSSCGIILLRVPATAPESLARRVVSSLESRSDWVGSFSVFEHDRIRMTPLDPRSRPSVGLSETRRAHRSR